TSRSSSARGKPSRVTPRLTNSSSTPTTPSLSSSTRLCSCTSRVRTAPRRSRNRTYMASASGSYVTNMDSSVVLCPDHHHRDHEGRVRAGNDDNATRPAVDNAIVLHLGGTGDDRVRPGQGPFHVSARDHPIRLAHPVERMLGEANLHVTAA